jgi:hypothetical protein
VHRARMPSVDVRLVGAKGRDLELETVFQHDDDAKMRTDRVGARKKVLHRFRLRVGSNVEILWRFATNDIAHATASEISDMAILPQACGHLACRLFHRRKSSLFHVFSVAAVCDPPKDGFAAANRRILNNATRQAKRLPYNFSGRAPGLLPVQKESIINKTTAIEMHESAILKAGQGCA